MPISQMRKQVQKGGITCFRSPSQQVRKKGLEPGFFDPSPQPLESPHSSQDERQLCVFAPETLRCSLAPPCPSGVKVKTEQGVQAPRLGLPGFPGRDLLNAGVQGTVTVTYLLI